MSDTYNDIKVKTKMVRDINLKAILKSVGACQDKRDNGKWHTSQGIISVKNQKFMNWTRMEGGGGAIDLIIHLHKFDFRTAVIGYSIDFNLLILLQPLT